MTGFTTRGEVCKVDDSLGLVIGWAVISKIGGQDHFDTQDEHIPDETMLKATLEFMESARTAKEMHRGDSAGEVVFGFPLTGEIAKALNIQTKQTGFIIGYKPSSPEILEKFRDGTYTGFSIGGKVDESHDVEDQAA
jgi:hypothetical protein